MALFMASIGMLASTSKSMCLMLYASMTCSFAAAWDATVPQTDDRYGPSATPKDTGTPPPSPRHAPIWLKLRDSFSGIVPPQDGTQPADEPSTNASVKNFCPVACAT